MLSKLSVKDTSKELRYAYAFSGTHAGLEKLFCLNDIFLFRM